MRIGQTATVQHWCPTSCYEQDRPSPPKIGWSHQIRLSSHPSGHADRTQVACVINLMSFCYICFLQLFCLFRSHLSQKGRPMDGLPPSQAALVEHIKRAAYQAGHVWAQMFVAVPTLPSPGEWGWLQTTEGSWKVKWTTLAEASHACRELLRCACKKGCRGQCKCLKASLQCTGLCLCGGQCDREWQSSDRWHLVLWAVTFNGNLKKI